MVQLRAWVAWIRHRYPLAKRVPACWAEHPEVVEELTALWLAWQQAYEDRRASLLRRRSGTTDGFPVSSTASNMGRSPSTAPATTKTAPATRTTMEWETRLIDPKGRATHLVRRGDSFSGAAR